MKRLFKSFIKPFLPKYEVVCTTYQIVPGLPITKKLSRHPFENGAAQEAKAFYDKVVTSEFTRTMAPIEVHLKKGRSVVSKTHFGPVDTLNKSKKIAEV